MDFLFIVLTIGFFGLSWGLVKLAQILMRENNA
jgi:hypothetical protein